MYVVLGGTLAGSSLSTPRKYVALTFGIDLGTILAGAGLTATAALVIEDLLTKTSDDDRVVPARVVTLIALTLLLIVGLAARRWTRARLGTLYYLRCLPEYMNDDKLALYEGGRRAHRDARVVTRWITKSPERGVLDLADEIADFSANLEARMADDDASTAFNVAPNMLFPVGLAVGYDLYPWPELRLEETNPRNSGRAQGSGRPSRSMRQRLPDLSWRLSDVPRIHARPVRVERPRGEHAPGPMLISAYFTQGTDLTAAGLNYAQSMSIMMPARAEHREASRRPTSVRVTTEPRVESTDEVHPRVVTDAVVSAVFDCLHDYPDRPILLFLRVPKTVALAIGIGLAQPSPGMRRCTSDQGSQMEHESCWHPWRRLVPVALNNERPDEAIAYRVHPAQPSAEVMRSWMTGSSSST